MKLAIVILLVLMVVGVFLMSFQIRDTSAKGDCIPTLDTLAATSVEKTTATLWGNLTDWCANTSTTRGFVWSTTSQNLPGNTTFPADTGYDSNWIEASAVEGIFSYGITSLTKGELYYYRTCANSTTGYWGYGDEEVFLTKPDAPPWLICCGNTTDNSTFLVWSNGIGRDTTLIRYANGSYPVDYNSGTLAYNSTGTVVDITGLNVSTTYYYIAWSWVTEGLLQQYSDETANCSETTDGPTPTPTPTPKGTINGTEIIDYIEGEFQMIGLVIFPLGLMTLALWQKKIWIMLGAGISFICLAAYGLIESSQGEAFWILGIFSIVFSFIVFLYAFFGMREPSEEIPFEEPDDAYARELKEAKEARMKRRTPWRRRSRL